METVDFVINMAARVRREYRDGREYLVAPMTMIVPGVLPGSKGPLYYPPEEVARNVADWDGIPLTVYHPTDKGQNVSANHPGILERQGIGHVEKPHIGKGGRLRAEGWFDVAKTMSVDPRVVKALNSGQPVELSTGLYTSNVPAPAGSVHNGVDRRGKPYSVAYSHIARYYKPDHLAALPDQRGACSLDHGCGILVNHGQGEDCMCGGKCSECKAKRKKNKSPWSALPLVEETVTANSWLAGNCGGPGGKPGPCPGYAGGGKMFGGGRWGTDVAAAASDKAEAASARAAQSNTLEDHRAAYKAHKKAADEHYFVYDLEGISGARMISDKRVPHEKAMLSLAISDHAGEAYRYHEARAEEHKAAGKRLRTGIGNRDLPAAVVNKSKGKKGVPSATLSVTPEKACRILSDGAVHGHPLTEAQRGMFGARCGQRGKKPAANVLLKPTGNEDGLSTDTGKDDLPVAVNCGGPGGKPGPCPKGRGPGQRPSEQLTAAGPAKRVGPNEAKIPSRPELAHRALALKDQLQAVKEHAKRLEAEHAQVQAEHDAHATKVLAARKADETHARDAAAASLQRRAASITGKAQSEGDEELKKAHRRKATEEKLARYSASVGGRIRVNTDDLPAAVEPTGNSAPGWVASQFLWDLAVGMVAREGLTANAAITEAAGELYRSWGGPVANVTKTEGDETLSAGDYAYVPDPESPSTWKLRIDDKAHVGGAVAAIGKGYRGQKVSIPSADLPAVKRRLRAAWKKFNKDKSEDEMPEVLAE